MESLSSPSDWNHIIALDGGTTNTRARLLNRGGEILATARRSVGVRDTAFSTGTSDRTRESKLAIREAIREAVVSAHDQGVVESADLPIDVVIAAGMLTSDVGLCAVPHVLAPAGLDELSRSVRIVRIPEIADCPIHLIPGIRTQPISREEGWFDTDVMRGEEVETFGAIELLRESGALLLHPDSPPSAFVWPGSHTKLIEIDSLGRISRSTTSLAGELTQAVWKHTLITASLPANWPAEIDVDAAEAGRRAVQSGGLGRAAFLVRIAAIDDRLGLEGRASFWIGAVLADDAAFLAGHPILKGTPRRPVWVGGREPLRGLLADSLQRLHPGKVLEIDDQTCEKASALGAYRCAIHATRMRGPEKREA